MKDENEEELKNAPWLKDRDPSTGELLRGWWSPESPSGKPKQPYLGQDMRDIMEKARNDPENWADM
jgi:hypothetical protein